MIYLLSLNFYILFSHIFSFPLFLFTFFSFCFLICCSYVVFEFVWKWWLEPKYRFGFAYIYINKISRKMGMAEVQIWISLNVYWGIRKKTDGLESKYRFGFAYIFVADGINSVGDYNSPPGGCRRRVCLFVCVPTFFQVSRWDNF